MRISNIPVCSSYSSNSIPKKISLANSSISFCLKPFSHTKASLDDEVKSAILKEEEYYKEFLRKKGKVNRIEYNDVVKNHPRTLAKCYRICDMQDEILSKPERIAKFAVSLKNYYDKLYKNYTIISIGTSPAPVTEVMKNIGCNVVFAPITSLRNYSENKLFPMRNIYPTIASKHQNVATLVKYLLKNGISKKEAGELVLIDFTHSGRTLDLMEQILEETGQINPDRINSHSIIDDLDEIYKLFNDFNLGKFEIDSFYDDLQNSRLEDVSNVPHFVYDGSPYYASAIVSEFKKDSLIFKEFDEYSTPKGRAWALCSTHEAMKILENV